MKILAAFFGLIILGAGALAQTSTNILATANGQQFTVQNLPPNLREAFESLQGKVAAARNEFLARQIADLLLKEEARARKTTIEKLVAAEVQRRIRKPTEAEIKSVYDANRGSFIDKSVAQVRPQIVAYLWREAEPKAFADFVAELKTKHKVVILTNVNSLNLKPADVLASIDGKPITAQSFEQATKAEVYELKADVYEQTSSALEQMVYSALILAEAEKLGLAPEAFVATLPPI